jgi:hypothetical protein
VLIAVVAVVIVAHLRRPQWHVLDGLVFALSVAIVWLGVVVGG